MSQWRLNKVVKRRVAGLDIVDNQIFHVCSRIQRIELVRHGEFPLTCETEKLVGHIVSSRLFFAMHDNTIVGIFLSKDVLN